MHFCRGDPQKCKRSGKARGPRGYNVQHVSIHREVTEEDLLGLRSGILFPGVTDKFYVDLPELEMSAGEDDEAPASAGKRKRNS